MMPDVTAQRDGHSTSDNDPAQQLTPQGQSGNHHDNDPVGAGTADTPCRRAHSVAARTEAEGDGSEPSHTHPADAETGNEERRRFRMDGTYYVAIAAVLLVVAQRFLMPYLAIPSIQTWSTTFVAISLQAMPFLVGGTLLSAAVAVLLPASFFQKVVPKNPALAVPVAACGAIALPGCECASVPVSNSLMKRGVAPAAALTFLLAAPAINPVVLVSTAVAFSGQPEFVLARFVASALVAVGMGWFWLALRRPELLRLPPVHEPEKGNRLEQFRASAVHDMLHAGGYLIIGAMIAATLKVYVPLHIMQEITDRPWLAVLFMATLAVLVALCSEADAFVAASFRSMGTTAQLVFMVVGPAVDVKLVAMQAGTFGRKFAAIFAPATFLMAIAMSALVAWWLL